MKISEGYEDKINTAFVIFITVFIILFWFFIIPSA